MRGPIQCPLIAQAKIILPLAKVIPPIIENHSLASIPFVGSSDSSISTATPYCIQRIPTMLLVCLLLEAVQSPPEESTDDHRQESQAYCTNAPSIRVHVDQRDSLDQAI